MKIDVFASPQAAVGDLFGKTVIVIDVLRATSCITNVVENGCRMVIPVVSIEEALSKASGFEKDEVLLCGERGGLLIDGFDLANSPLEYSRDRVFDKVVITTTSNGTIAINAAKGAENVLIGCMRNAGAVAKKANGLGKDIAIICAGTAKRYSTDDIFCAGSIIKSLLELDGYELCDLSKTALMIYESTDGEPEKVLSGTVHFEKMKALGFYDDLRFCFDKNASNTVPVFSQGAITR